MFQSAPGGEAGEKDSPSSEAIQAFQSAPGGEAGGKATCRHRSVLDAPFQSAPGGEAGGKLPSQHGPEHRTCFNPPPAVRPGESGDRAMAADASGVSIRPRR